MKEQHSGIIPHFRVGTHVSGEDTMKLWLGKYVTTRLWDISIKMNTRP